MHWNRPKSVRQIGDVPGRDRIYIEDYVVRFAKELAGQGRGLEKAAVLLGNTFLNKEEKIYQISGIVEIPGFADRGAPALQQNIWDRIYTEIKENFTDLEIVGWFFSCRGFPAKQAPQLLEIHKQNFQHRDKVLYIYEENEKEDGFFLYRNGRFESQKGYYIYYEKNPEMLAYMEHENNRRVHIVEQEDDRVVRNIRGIMEEKEQLREKTRKRQGRESRLGYSLGSMVALIALVIGVATFRNQNALNQVKRQVEHLQQMALGEQKKQQTVIETMGSGLTKATATPAAASAAAAAGKAEAGKAQDAGQTPVAK
ncbi:MAG: hypothetical protein J6C32_05690 [Eubacterium sp.]|nr:hypothetical protein [Eubacterium sp.]